MSSSARSWSLAPQQRRAVAVAAAAVLFAAILGLRIAGADGAQATLVLLVPIAVCAIEFGLVGGVTAGLVALALLIGWELVNYDGAGPLGVGTRATAYLLVGGLLGRFVDKRRALEAEVERHRHLSLDLICTANFDGYFTRLNPAWEKTLGYTQAELMSRPFSEFVHPDDRERTSAQAARLSENGTDAVRFRNRYRTADGEYRWLEWNARAETEEGRIYAIARDITVQQQAEDALQKQSDILERAVRERTRALQEARLDALHRLALAAEYRDDDTHQHTERVGRTAALIAQQLGLSEESAALFRHAAPLHDVGKIGVPDAILLKPGKLTADEFRAMQEHVTIGAKLLANGKLPILKLAEEIALTHHERWDGDGYIQGLQGTAIPLSGRIVAVADVFDALTHDRPYKQAWPIEDAVAEIDQLAGKQFDPGVVEAFAALDHHRLLAPVEDYDLELPPPPLAPPPDSTRLASNGPATLALA